MRVSRLTKGFAAILLGVAVLSPAASIADERSVVLAQIDYLSAAFIHARCGNSCKVAGLPEIKSKYTYFIKFDANDIQAVWHKSRLKRLLTNAIQTELSSTVILAQTSNASDADIVFVISEASYRVSDPNYFNSCGSGLKIEGNIIEGGEFDLQYSAKIDNGLALSEQNLELIDLNFDACVEIMFEKLFDFPERRFVVAPPGSPQATVLGVYWLALWDMRKNGPIAPRDVTSTLTALFLK